MIGMHWLWYPHIRGVLILNWFCQHSLPFNRNIKGQVMWYLFRDIIKVKTLKNAFITLFLWLWHAMDVADMIHTFHFTRCWWNYILVIFFKPSFNIFWLTSNSNVNSAFKVASHPYFPLHNKSEIGMNLMPRLNFHNYFEYHVVCRLLYRIQIYLVVSISK